MRVAELTGRVNLEPLNTLHDKEIVAGNILVSVESQNRVTDATGLADIGAIVVTEGKTVASDALQAADRAEITIFSTPLPSPDFVGELDALGIRITPYGEIDALGIRITPYG